MTLPNGPIVDQERITSVYEELKNMEVFLDPNPIEFGPRRFNNRIAQVRALLTRLEQLYLQASEDWHFFRRQITSRTTIYELEKRELMVNDPRCRMGRHQGERGDLADVQLRPQIEEIRELELAAYDLETLMTAIKSRRTDLKDTQLRMREQMKLIEHDLGMGARWGDAAPPMAVSREPDELDTMLNNVDSKLGWTSDDEKTPEEEEEEEDEVPSEESVLAESTPTSPPVEPEPFVPEEHPVLEFEPYTDFSNSILDDNSAPPKETVPELSSTEDEINDFFDTLDNVPSERPIAQSSSALDGIDDLIATLANE